jgi:anti-sigma B factor antagonist
MDTTPVGKNAALPISADGSILKVYQVGPLTVVGFAGMDVPDEVCIAGYRDQLTKLLDEHKTEVLAFDCSGVKLMPSGMLGLLTSLRKRVSRVELYNPSDDVRMVLRLTNLEPLFDIKTVNL